MSWAGDTWKYHLRFFSILFFSFKNISSKMESRLNLEKIEQRENSWWQWQSFRWCRVDTERLSWGLSVGPERAILTIGMNSHIQSLILIIKFSLAFEKVYIYTGRKATVVSWYRLLGTTYFHICNHFIPWNNPSSKVENAKQQQLFNESRI